MSGSKMTTQRKAILAAVKESPPTGDYIWDGKDEGDRPLDREEMQKVLRHTVRNEAALSAPFARSR